MTLAKSYFLRCDRCGVAWDTAITADAGRSAHAARDARAEGHGRGWSRSTDDSGPHDLCPRCTLEDTIQPRLTP